ncbi:MAG: hypothetical protein MJ213_03840 [Bacilli bacterium]|nr:hypothetical protein [Bacilli bacterium]
MKIINIRKEKSSLKELERLRLKKYFYNEIRIDNIHLLLVNRFLKNKIFSKDSIYVAPSTLWASMKKSCGRDESHNFHNLSPRTIYDSLCTIKSPEAIYKSKRYINRFIIVTPITYNKEHIIVIVEIGARLVNDINANINKLVTIYPKDKISLNNNELLYQK